MQQPHENDDARLADGLSASDRSHGSSQAGTVARTGTATAACAAVSDGSPYRLLLVDDTPANLKILARLLEKRGYLVELAGDGNEAVALYRSRDYDAILMDLQMPGLDGFGATTAIREMRDRRQVPIIALTAQVVDGTRERCLAVGMSDYLAKPIDFALLTSTIESQLKSSDGFR